MQQQGGFDSQAPLARWMRRLTLAGLLLCFGVVVLGAYVRLTAAGLGCPDWPGCYGHLSPVGAQLSAAAQAAFLQGDILVRLDGTPVTNADDLQGLLGPNRVGSTMSASVVRGGELRELSVTVGTRE